MTASMRKLLQKLGKDLRGEKEEICSGAIYRLF